ncbi:MAG: heavy metal translocating P-type ATPase [Chitinophagaceae bacterium]
MEKVVLQVAGMDCANCALTIRNYLQKQGMDDVRVNYVSGDVAFVATTPIDMNNISKGIEKLGYTVQKPGAPKTTSNFWQWSNKTRIYVSALFTLPLMLHMIPGVHIHWLMNPWVQLAFTLPVFAIGMATFFKSAWNSAVSGVPNMNVLIVLGSVAALVYSLYGAIIGAAEQYMFFETTATIITLVLIGNALEDASIAATQKQLNALAVNEELMANMIAYDGNYQENLFQVPAKDLKVGDLILVKSGETVPADCKVLWGDVTINESIITGESEPLPKKMNDILVGGSIVVDGSFKAYVTAVGDAAVLSQIKKMVQDAQSEKPPVQQLADKISAIFVPTVVAIAVITVFASYFLADISFGAALLRGIAVLVIACPCAMGLATPAAVAVGLGRAARTGILFRNAKSLELFKNIRQVVFDKTGTLTTGNFSLERVWLHPDADIDEATFQQYAFSLEKYSNHPIAKCVAAAFKSKTDVRWQKIEEVKGVGMFATDAAGNQWAATNYKYVSALTTDASFNVYITKNNTLIGALAVIDEIRPEAKEVIAQLHQQGIKTVLLSGDTLYKAQQVGHALGIQTIIAEQKPEDKLATIARLNAEVPTAMVGDGINDAPALAKATVGVSVSNASQLTMQHAGVVLVHKGLALLPTALCLGKYTYRTIQTNLFWALSYNVIAIPIAAFGLLNPMIGALVMGLSDVVLAINSLWLRFRKLNY